MPRKLTVNDMGLEPGVDMILGAKCDSARYMNRPKGQGIIERRVSP